MILGIDPGASGALAFFDILNGSLTLVDMPTVEIERSGKTKREISAAMLAGVIRAHGVQAGVVEKVGAMPGQGVSSMFQFGRSVGMVEGVLAGLSIKTHYLTPQTWQKAVGLRGGKDGARSRAAELFPAYAPSFSRKKDNGRADAALIAYAWGIL
jgi:crossover junction endodeoxyribonuclease RuvC